ncbi:MAG: hypothetical protein ACI3W9_02565 [Eubacteriales bacterium]
MKKFTALVTALMLLLCGCAGDEPESVLIDTGLLAAYYKTVTVTDWRVVSALWLSGEDIADYNVALTAGNSAYGKACYTLAAAVTELLFTDSTYSCDVYTEDLIFALKNPSGSASEIATILLALYAVGSDYDPTAALDCLKTLQLKDGGFGADEYASRSDAKASATVLEAITAYRVKYGDDESRDRLLVYLADSINDDNTIDGSDGVPSASATAAVLTALIYAGIPNDGEISTALRTALNGFSVGGTFAEIRNGSFDRNATAEVYFCAAAAMRGSIFEAFGQNRS